MSEVVVRVPEVLRPFAGDAGEVSVAPGSVAEVLQQLGARHPNLLTRLLNPEGELRPYVNLFVGRANVRALQGLATVVPAGTIVSILPAVAGG
jgi:molybdopterin converting factor small subunit